MPKTICEKYYNKNNDVFHFFLTECNFGTSGFNCEHKCDTCNKSICERIDGYCTNGCIAGYYGYLCQLRGI